MLSQAVVFVDRIPSVKLEKPLPMSSKLTLFCSSWKSFSPPSLLAAMLWKIICPFPWKKWKLTCMMISDVLKKNVTHPRPRISHTNLLYAPLWSQSWIWFSRNYFYRNKTILCWSNHPYLKIEHRRKYLDYAGTSNSTAQAKDQLEIVYKWCFGAF